MNDTNIVDVTESSKSFIASRDRVDISALLSELNSRGEAFIGGSTAVCGSGVDIDLFWLPVMETDYRQFLFDRGFLAASGGDYPEDHFSSWRNGDANVIVCHKYSYFFSTKAATQVLKWMACNTIDPKDKTDRIYVHEFLQDMFDRNTPKLTISPKHDFE